MAKFVFLSLFLITSLYFISLLAHSYNVRSLFVFGDSLFDAGNNHFNNNCTVQADFFPYGFNFFRRPTGRFTNGRTVVDFIDKFLGIEFQKPYLEVEMALQSGAMKNFPTNGINFASAGSGVLSETNRYMEVTPLRVQVQQFQALITQNQIDKTQIQNSVILLESGSNDIFNYFLPFDTHKLEPNAHIQSMLLEVERFITQIYDLGARKIVILSAGVIGCVPARALLPEAPLNKCFGKMNKMAKEYNLCLENMVNGLHVKFPGLVSVYGAVYTITRPFLTAPKRYGFEEVSKACCGNGPLGGTIQCGKEGYMLCKNPNRFVFWDYFHPSEHTYNLVSKALWRGRSHQIRPINLKVLASLGPNQTALPFNSTYFYNRA